MIKKPLSPIAIVCFTTGTGGMPFDAIKFARLTSKHTHVYLLCYKGTHLAELKGKIEENLNITVIVMDFNRYLSLKFVSPRLVFDVRKIIADYNIENIVIFGTSELKSLYVSCLFKSINIVMRHGTTKSSRKKGIFYKLIYGSVNYHIAISQHLVANIKKIFPVAPHSKVVMIYPSLNIGCESNRVTRDVNKLRILHTGRVEEGKGQSDAILACKGLKDRGIDFEAVFVGDVDNEKYYQCLIDMVEDNGLSANVTFKGHVNNVGDYLFSSDIFLYPSYGEGFCNSFAEALASGIVCLSYDNTTFSEFHELGFYTHLVGHKDVDELTDKLLYLAENLSKEQSASLRNVVMAKKIFNKQDELLKLITVLK